jgi:hypothetical protein
MPHKEEQRKKHIISETYFYKIITYTRTHFSTLFKFILVKGHELLFEKLDSKVVPV